MSEHLPECHYTVDTGNIQYGWNECICTELRACEQRMLDDDVPAAAYHGEKGYTMGYIAALDAAEQAVAAMPTAFWTNSKANEAQEHKARVRAAIRALKEK